MDANFSLYSFFYNTSLLLFAKLREVQVVYIGNKVVLLHALNFRSLKMLTIPQGFSLEVTCIVLQNISLVKMSMPFIDLQEHLSR